MGAARMGPAGWWMLRRGAEVGLQLPWRRDDGRCDCPRGATSQLPDRSVTGSSTSLVDMGYFGQSSGGPFLQHEPGKGFPSQPPAPPAPALPLPPSPGIQQTRLRSNRDQQQEREESDPAGAAPGVRPICPTASRPAPPHHSPGCPGTDGPFPQPGGGSGLSRVGRGSNRAPGAGG